MQPAKAGMTVVDSSSLFGAAGKTSSVKLNWSEPAPKSVWHSDTSEKPLAQVKGALKVPAWGLVALRVE